MKEMSPEAMDVSETQIARTIINVARRRLALVGIEVVEGGERDAPDEV